MRIILSSLLIFTLLYSCTTTNNKTPEEVDTVISYKNFESEFVDARNVDVWLPQDYDSTGTEKYAVLYVHDGQNLFDPEVAFMGTEWGIDEAITKLMSENKIRKTIVVGIWNTDKRFRDYQPSKPFENHSEDMQNKLTKEYNGTPLGDEYLRFIVEELKPYIDATYNTLTDKSNTFIMGSSMGGLISLYALCEYPDVFGGAACLSTHYPVSVKENLTKVAENNIAYFKQNIPDADNHRIYFDYGTEHLDAWYETYQVQMNMGFVAFGYQMDKNLISKKFKGETHNEAAWRKRVHIPLEFLLKK